MKTFYLALLGILFVIEALYFNIFFDYVLIAFLLTLSLAVGGLYRIQSRNLDTVLVKIALGLGSIGFFVWLTTFYNLHHKSLFLIIGFLLILWRHNPLVQDFRDLFVRLAKLSKTHTPLLALLLIGMILYTIPGSYPIQQWDALAKHIVIPSQILNHGYYDYNVVESIIFGDYALFAHMLYFFLLVLGGTKALVLLNVTVSLLTLATVLRISAILTQRVLPLLIIAALYLTTPLIYNYSTILNTDIYPIFFIAVALLLIQYDKITFLSRNLPLIALLFGFAFYSKQVAFYMIIPLSVYIIFLLIKGRKYSSRHLFAVIGLSIGLFFVPFLPSMLLIWYKTGNPLFPFLNGLFKSPYFAPSNFQDPYTVWQRFLGFDLHSLLSIVFDTSRNTEYVNRSSGFHLLLLPLVLIVWPFLLKTRRFLSLLLITFGSYWISITFFNPNIRYFLGAIVFAIPLTIIALDMLMMKLQKSFYRYWILSIVAITFVTMNAIVITKSNNPLGFKKAMLIPDNRLTSAPNESILSSINQKEIYLLSNNDNLRGTYKGHFYTLSWYNTMLVLKLLESNNPLEFFTLFDYYLVDKLVPLASFDPKIYLTTRHEIYPKNSVVTERIQEDERYVLYKIIKPYRTLLDKNLSVPETVTVDTPKIIPFTKKATSYKIYLDMMPASAQQTMGRFQINWMDKKGDFAGVSLVPFDIKEERAVYESDPISNIPANATTGNLYLTSHTTAPVRIYGYELAQQGGSFVQDELEKYGQKIMPVYK